MTICYRINGKQQKLLEDIQANSPGALLAEEQYELIESKGLNSEGSKDVSGGVRNLTDLDDRNKAEANIRKEMFAQC